MFSRAARRHHPISFGRGGLHVELAEGELSWLVSLGPHASADLLAEMIAALVYHYEPDVGGGTAITDVFINDGDFSRHGAGATASFDVRLTAARRREPGVGPNLLLLYLIQMMAYEDWSVGGGLTGLPTLVGNPSVAFAGAVRGRRHRYRDLGRPEEDGRARGARLDPRFRPLARGPRLPALGRPLPRRAACRRRSGTTRASGGGGWSRSGRSSASSSCAPARIPRPSEAASARALRAFVDRLSREIGRVPDGKPGVARINDLGRADLLALLEEAQAPRRCRATTSPMRSSRAGRTAAWITCWRRSRARARCAG